MISSLLSSLHMLQNLFKNPKRDLYLKGPLLTFIKHGGGEGGWWKRQ